MTTSRTTTTPSCTATAATPPLEPWLSEQWFVAVDKLEGAVPPRSFATDRSSSTLLAGRDTYLTWMDNLKDWCISRQLWWGHRIPVFYCEDCGWEDALMEDTDVCPKCGGHHIHQDEDVLDTWFSSQLWTFATQGWPDDTTELAEHHPTKVLVTARDIIALWVARMIMSSLYFTDEIPFHDVYIYATILAKDGSRMSKSKGNGVDPMALMDKYGADAMRFNLLTLITNNQDVKFDANIDKKTKELIDSPRTEQARGFVTKIWNASRFVQMNLGRLRPPARPRPRRPRTPGCSRVLPVPSPRPTEQLETYNFGDVRPRHPGASSGAMSATGTSSCARAACSTAPPTRTLQVQRNLVYVLDCVDAPASPGHALRHRERLGRASRLGSRCP